MSLDPSLKSKNALVRHRNVLSRAERIAKLEGDGKWSPEDGVFSLPKIAHRKTTVGGKTKRAAAPTEEGAATTEATPGEKAETPPAKPKA
jgi:small basic protein (TIGR04137 family)